MVNATDNKKEKVGRNKIATIMEAIGYGTYVLGFIAGFSLATVEVPYQFISGTRTQFSIGLLLAYWAGFFVSGTVFLGFAEIIDLLQKLVDQGDTKSINFKEDDELRREEQFSDLPEL